MNELTNNKVFKTLIIFSIPFLLSYFLQTLYGLADLFIITQFNEPNIITAVSNGSQIMHMVTVIIVGLSTGITITIGNAVGKKDTEKIKKTISNSIILFSIASIILSIIAILLCNTLIKVLDVPSDAVEATKSYLVVCFIGIPFIFGYNIISSTYRGLGDSKTPMILISVSCIINIGLDFLLVGLFSMQAIGAAIATVFSQGLCVLIGVITLIKNKNIIKPTKDDFKLNNETTFHILKNGLPIAIQDGLIQIAFITITILANKRGSDISASVGIVEKLISFLFIVSSSMLSSISAMAAQNIGANKHNQAFKTFLYGLLITMVFATIVTIPCAIWSEGVISIITKNETIIKYASQYLRSYIFDTIFAGIHFCFSGYFCAYGYSIFSFIHNITSLSLVRIPVAFLAWRDHPNSLFEMGVAAPLGSLLSVIICLLIFIILLTKKKIKLK